MSYVSDIIYSQVKGCRMTYSTIKTDVYVHLCTILSECDLFEIVSAMWVILFAFLPNLKHRRYQKDWHLFLLVRAFSETISCNPLLEFSLEEVSTIWMSKNRLFALVWFDLLIYTNSKGTDPCWDDRPSLNIHRLCLTAPRGCLHHGLTEPPKLWIGEEITALLTNLFLYSQCSGIACITVQ